MYPMELALAAAIDILRLLKRTGISCMYKFFLVLWLRVRLVACACAAYTAAKTSYTSNPVKYRFCLVVFLLERSTAAQPAFHRDHG